MKLPENNVAVPSPRATKTPAAPMMRMASQSTSSPRSRLVATPTISSAMAPQLRISSGRINSRLRVSSIEFTPSRRQSELRREPRLLGGGKACVIGLDQGIDRDGRRIENRRGIDAEQDGERDERRHHRDLAPGQVGDELEVRVLQSAEDDTAIEVERVRGRQDDAGGGEERDPGVDAERPCQAQKLADEAGRAG